MSIAIVTDSTASLPDAAGGRPGLSVVPLHVVVDGVDHIEGVDITAPEVAAALRRRASVSTSRPTPTALLGAYVRAAEAGAEAIVSMHLSGELSGTLGAAQAAARQSPVPVEVLDSRAVGMALGFAVLGAHRDAERALALSDLLTRARRRLEASRLRVCVDTLEHLRRGGRIGGAAALLGTALSIKPLLALEGGTLTPVEKVRTSSRALHRLEELAVGDLREVPEWASGMEVAVHHLGADDRARDLADRLQERLGHVVERVPLSAVLAAHVGPGTVAVVTSPQG